MAVYQIGTRALLPAILLMLVKATAQQQRPVLMQLDFILQKHCPMRCLALAAGQAVILQPLATPLATEAEQMVARQGQADGGIGNIIAHLLP